MAKISCLNNPLEHEIEVVFLANGGVRVTHRSTGAVFSYAENKTRKANYLTATKKLQEFLNTLP